MPAPRLNPRVNLASVLQLTSVLELASVLEHTELFKSLSQPELETLAARTVRKLFSAGELLFSEGEPCNELRIIASGKVRIFKTSIGGREQILAVNGPGETVAELPVFDGGSYPASQWPRIFGRAVEAMRKSLIQIDSMIGNANGLAPVSAS